MLGHYRIKLKKFLSTGVILIFFLLSGQVYATHIRAGEITATLVNCNTNTYLITITGYTDTDSDVQFGGGELNFGDGRKIEFVEGATDWSDKQPLAPGVEITRFVIEHTFPGPGRYTITFFERNRNDHVVNMARSVDTPFYIETTIIIDPLLGCNNSPVMEVPPVDRACVGKSFIHNPGVYDVDGDSISYEIVINKKALNTLVDQYRFPNDPSFNGAVENGTAPATFTMDTEGNLVWNSPGTAGEYNLAFLVIEWRQAAPGEWVRIGSVTRDMQVIVDGDCRNEPPELILPNDTCVEAGTLLEDFVVGIDPDGDDVRIEWFGEAFSFSNNKANVNPLPAYRPQPDTVRFSWQTSCDHIRKDPYKFSFKISDRPTNGGTPLADIQLWNVHVVGPKPQGLTVTNMAGGEALVSWDPYTCVNAERIQVWRRVDTNPFVPGNCETGLPLNAGYELVGDTTAGALSFVDDNAGLRLQPGVTYCYRLVALFDEGVESYASDEFCISTIFDAPVITNVSVEETDATAGGILVKWMAPTEVDPADFPPPYLYEVYRIDGSGTGQKTLITGRIAETEFIDTGLNTQANVYSYLVYMYDAANRLVDSSAAASSVRLELNSLVGSLELNWSANTPWSNSYFQHPWHYIYRDHVDAGNPDALVLIDSVNVLQQGFTYLDDGSATNMEELSKDETYCYYVITSGSYGNSAIPSPLFNLSQINCGRPNDTIPPCLPPEFTFGDFNSPDECQEFINNTPCGFNNFTNTLTWTADFGEGCDTEIRGFKIYFSETGLEGSYEEIAERRDTFYVHRDLLSFAGCYKIATVDRSGNVSELSDPLCKDNCPVYELPNVITPNNDEANNTLEPMGCPRFIESVVIKIYNRWGTEVYNSAVATGIENPTNWDGRSNDGQELPTGVYYYLAEVKYQALNPDKAVYEIKGWIHVLR